MSETTIVKATRYNEGKPRLGLIPPQIMEGLGHVLAFGAQKYDENNWKKGLTDEECISSCLRHIAKYQRGLIYDDESGIHHLAHAACNLAFMLYFHEQNGIPLVSRQKVIEPGIMVNATYKY